MSDNTPPAHASIQTPRYSTILDLPAEILQTAFRYLSRGDHIKCSTVCKSWSFSSKAFIWSTIGTRFSSKLLHDSTVGAALLSKYAHHVRQLEIRNESILEYLFMRKTMRLRKERHPWSQFQLFLDLNSTLLTNLRRLDIWCPLDSSTKSTDARIMASALIKNSSRLVALEIHRPQRLETAVDLIDGCEKLQELYISFAIDPRSAKIMMGHTPDSVRKLRLEVSRKRGFHGSDHQVSGGTDVVDGAASKNSHSHSNLECLEIGGNFQGWEEYLLLSFLATCGTNLKEFWSPDTDCFKPRKLSEALIKAGASLDWLQPHHFPRGRDSADLEIANTITQHRRLQTITLQYCRAAGPLTAGAIVDCGQHLQDLELSNCRNLSSVDLVSILRSARKLRRFTTKFWNGDGMEDPFISADDLIATQWYSPCLQIFLCDIKMPQHNQDVPAKAVDPTMNHPSIMHSDDAQRAVYRQIALQTNLRCLGLGYVGWTSHDSIRLSYQWNSLEMTLQSGLGELATLKKLRRLYVEFMNHSIGVPELEWMAENWPRLESIHGLFQNGKDRDRAVVEWLDVNKPEWASRSRL
ncbi:hypothetical protein BGZ81_000346 [Podila clonocystis]|nr:hypothetical protein BGZ81_000346 [Podila clonocystis]